MLFSLLLLVHYQGDIVCSCRFQSSERPLVGQRYVYHRCFVTARKDLSRLSKVQHSCYLACSEVDLKCNYIPSLFLPQVSVKYSNDTRRYIGRVTERKRYICLRYLERKECGPFHRLSCFVWFKSCRLVDLKQDMIKKQSIPCAAYPFTLEKVT